MPTKVRFRERAQGNHPQAGGTRRVQCRFDKCLADMMPTLSLRHFGVNQRNHVLFDVIRQKGRLIPDHDLEAITIGILDDRHIGAIDQRSNEFSLQSIALVAVNRKRT